MNPGWRRRAARTGDGGFTLLEVVISVVLVGIMMTALVSFFVSTTAILNQQRDRQVAVQLADSVMEGVRAKGLTIVTGRTAGNADTEGHANLLMIQARGNNGPQLFVLRIYKEHAAAVSLNFLAGNLQDEFKQF